MAGGRLAGKVALITGAGRGFGRAIAEAFAREGARVAANYLGSRAGAEAVVAEAERLGAEAVALRGDVAREDDVTALVAATLARFGRLDVLVNNAGIMVRAPMLAVPAEECRRMFDVNVTGTMLCSRHALPADDRAEGRPHHQPLVPARPAPGRAAAASRPTRPPRAPSNRSPGCSPPRSAPTASP